jgi:hypothetical protein
MQISKWLFVILASSLLMACSNSDGDNNTTPPPSPPPEPVPTPPSLDSGIINSQNATTVASDAFSGLSSTSDAGNELSDLSTGIGNDFVGGVDIDTGGDLNVVDRAKRLIERANSGIPATSAIATGVVITENDIPCEEGGSYDFIWEDNDDNEEFSAGDTITTIDDNCVEYGETTNGQISVTLHEDEPNLSMTMIFTDFTTIDSEGTSTLNGDLSVIIEDSSESFSISSTSFSFSDSEFSATFSNVSLTGTTSGTLESLVMTADTLTVVEEGVTETFSNVSSTFTEDSNTLVYTMDLNETFDAPELGGTVSVDTLQPFEELESDEFPYTGIMKITASDNSSVTLTALDAVNVRLEVDEDGDGAIDETINDTTWASLDIL